MAEEAVVIETPAVETATPETPPAQAPEPTPYEDKARAKGWKPKEEFEGDTADWVSAEEFVKREPLFDRIRNQSKELKELRRTVEEMAKFHHQSVKVAVDREIRALQAQKREAIELGDVQKVEAIDDAIQKQKAELPPAPKAGSDMPEEMTTWLERNAWFKTNADMRDFAAAHNEMYLKRHPGELQKALEETEKATKKAFPEHFAPKENPNKEKPSAVEGAAPRGNGQAKYSESRLSADQRRVFQQYKKAGVMDIEEYCKSLEQIGELQ